MSPEHGLTISGMASNHSRLDGSVILLSGPMASGKSTVANLLAATFPKAVHIEGDVFRRFIVSGRHEMTPDPSEEALSQLRLRYLLAAEVAEEYARTGYTVVVEDVVAGLLLNAFVSLFSHRPLHLVVLFPSEEAITQREAGRTALGYGNWSIHQLRGAFAEGTERVGLWLDTSAETPEETVQTILSRASESALP
jgi:chloramphenicol 3-O-phosphotransferase